MLDWCQHLFLFRLYEHYDYCDLAYLHYLFVVVAENNLPKPHKIIKLNFASQ
jgi:hypothetical protein